MNPSWDYQAKFDKEQAAQALQDPSPYTGLRGVDVGGYARLGLQKAAQTGIPLGDFLSAAIEKMQQSEATANALRDRIFGGNVGAAESCPTRPKPNSIRDSVDYLNGLANSLQSILSELLAKV